VEKSILSRIGPLSQERDEFSPSSQDLFPFFPFLPCAGSGAHPLLGKRSELLPLFFPLFHFSEDVGFSLRREEEGEFLSFFFLGRLWILGKELPPGNRSVIALFGGPLPKTSLSLSREFFSFLG